MSKRKRKQKATKIAITITVFENAEEWLRENVRYLSSDSVACVRPVTRVNLNGKTMYEDVSGEMPKDLVSPRACTLADHIRALRQLASEVGRTLFVGGIKHPLALQDAGNWDVEVTDAFWQFVMHKKVIYG